jgi:Rrf2 family protein
MRISAKGRYALAATISMSEQYRAGEYITVISIAEKLGISKIYLEQVFSLLKRGGIVTSIKGSQGGYQLTRMPRQINVLEVLSAVELSMFEPAEETVAEKALEIEVAMRLAVFERINDSLRSVMANVTLEDLVFEAKKHKKDTGYMYYI